MRKTTFREIKSSFGRYMAILMIIALGVGFFCGLRGTYEAMLHKANAYWTELNFYDYQLVSTIGFDEDAEEELRKKEDVKAVEGIKSVDAMLFVKDEEEEVKVMTLPEEVNQLHLSAGRLPEQKNECVVDDDAFNESAIGKTIYLTDTNKESTKELFNATEFTIVGLVKSPIYIYYERGTTSIGDGKLNFFAYVPESTFDMDYFTEIYVTFQQDAKAYSLEYDDFMDGKEDAWEDICEEVADSRYERIYNEAYAELEDGKAEFEEEKADGAKELEDALAEIEDGEKQIEDGANAIAKARQTIADNATKLADSEAEIEQGYADYEAGKAQYDTGKAQYDAAVAELSSQYATYESNVKLYTEQKSAYAASEEQYKAAKEAYEAGKAYLTPEQQQQKERSLATWRSQLDAIKTQLTAFYQQLVTAKTQLDAAKKQLDETGAILAKTKEELDLAKTTLDEAKKQIDDGKAKLTSARNQLATKEQELADARVELADGRAEYEDGKAEFDEKIAEAELELADAEAELKDFEEPEVYVLGRDMNTGYANFDNNAKILLGVAKVFPFFFILVAALVCITTMTRMMEEQRTQVGILKALGYSNGSIIGKYLVYSGSAAVIGSVVGFFSVTAIFTIVIWEAYKMMYNMGTIACMFDFKMLIIATLVALLCTAGTTVFSCYQDLLEMAAALMRPKAPKVGTRVLLEKIPFIWNRLKFLDKVSIRNLFRYKKRLFMMIVGVSGCTALLVTALGLRDSISTLAEDQYGKIFLYDLAVTVSEDVEAVEGVKESTIVSSTSIDVVKDGTKSANLLVPKEPKELENYIDLHTSKYETIEFPQDNEIVISHKLAEELDIKVGDEITIQNTDLAGGTVTVSAIMLNYFQQYAFMNEATYESVFDETIDYNVIFANVEDGEDVHQVSTNYMKDSNVKNVLVTEDLRKNVADMMKSVDYVVLMVVLCAALLAFIVIYNLNNINITERIREIATVKVLGFYREETKSYIFRENIVLTIIGGLVGLLLGYFLHMFVMDQIKVDGICFNVKITTVSYIASFILTVLFNQIVNLFMAGKLESVNMAESLKSVE